MYSRELQNKLLELSEHEYRLYWLRKVRRLYASDKLPAYSKEIDLYSVLSTVHAGSVVFTKLPA